ncbi:MAG: nucleotidyltransferase substrate binding protein [Burkholderiales bacterium]
MKQHIAVVAEGARSKAIRSISLFAASVRRYRPFDPKRRYTPKQLEPYDAMADRYIRAVEASIRFFRAYERYQFGETSDTLRDLLSRMEKLGLVSSVQLWIEMRDQRNRIVHEYLPEKIKQIYQDLAGKMSKELLAVKEAGVQIRLASQ